MLQRVKEVQESDLRMVGALARNIQRVLPVTQADIDAAAAQGKGWLVKRVVKVNDPLDNLRGGTQLVIKQNSIQPGQNVMRVMYIGGQAVVVGPGTSPLSLPDAIANSLSYVKAFGGTEQRNLPDNYIERQFVYMMDGSYLLTDIVPTYDGRIEMDFQTTSVQSGATSYLGGRSESYPAGLRLGTGSNNSRLIVTAFSDSAYTATTVVENNTRYKFTFNNKVATLESGGSTLFTNTFTGENANGAALVINGLNNAGTITANLEGIYLYSFKAWNAQGELIANYVPAVQKGTVPVVGFYDTVSKTFKTATAGTFAAGDKAVPTPDAPMDIVSNNGVLKARHQSGLPLGYTLLDSVVFDATQVIDTGFIPDNDTRIESKCYRTSADCWFYGASPANPRVSLFHSNNGTSRWGYQSRSNVGFVSNTEYTIIEDKNGLNINGVDNPWTSGTADDFTCDRSLTIGNCNGATGTRYFAGNFYYMKIYDNNVLVRDFVPCQNASNVVGLYDRVNGVFYTDTGLVAGDPVSDPVEIYTDGTVETIGMRAENLVDNTILSANINMSGKIVSSSAVFITHTAPVIPGETYTCNNVSTLAYYTSKPDVGSVSYDNNRIVTTSPTFTVPNDPTIKYVAFRNATADSWVVKGSTKYNGGTATAEMLLKIGNYQDVQSVIDGVVTRKVGVKVLDGTESFSSGQASGVQCISIPKTAWGISSDTLPADSLDLICTHYKAVNGSDWTQSKLNTIKVGSGYLFFNTQYVQDSTSFKAYLAEQYAAGTPVIIIYPLDEPTTESVAGQTLQVTDGDNTLEITQASLSGLELEAEYTKAS